jgi:uncharacterized protein YjiS (DUF1127 family)
MAAFTPSLFRAIGRYANKVRTLRDDIRTRRLLNSLSDQTRRDIGWPDQFSDRRVRHD